MTNRQGRVSLNALPFADYTFARNLQASSCIIVLTSFNITYLSLRYSCRLWPLEGGVDTEHHFAARFGLWRPLVVSLLLATKETPYLSLLELQEVSLFD
jgi:hypothetical protein